MSEIGDTFKIIKEQNKVKKQSNLDYSTALLLETKFSVSINNGGVHLVVANNGVIVDFWPSTGKWIIRGGITSRGVNGLIRFLDKKGKH